MARVVIAACVNILGPVVYWDKMPIAWDGEVCQVFRTTTDGDFYQRESRRARKAAQKSITMRKTQPCSKGRSTDGARNKVACKQGHKTKGTCPSSFLHDKQVLLLMQELLKTKSWK